MNIHHSAMNHMGRDYLVMHTGDEITPKIATIQCHDPARCNRWLHIHVKLCVSNNTLHSNQMLPKAKHVKSHIL